MLPDFLHEYNGIAAGYIYTGEFFFLAHGGMDRNRGTKYRGNLDLVLTADTEAMGLWEGGKFFLYGNSFHGRTLTANHVGDAEFYNNIDSRPRPADEFQVAEYWYEHSFANGDIIVKLGKQDAKADFAFVDLGGASTFGIPTGASMAFSTVGDFGAMTLQEISLTPQFRAEGELPCRVCLGNWYHTHSFENLQTNVVRSTETTASGPSLTNCFGRSPVQTKNLRDLVPLPNGAGLREIAMRWKATTAAA